MEKKFKEKKIQIRNPFDEVIHLYMNRKRANLEKVGLYIGQPVALEVLYQNPGLTQIEIASLCGVKAPTVHVMLERLAKKGIIEKRTVEKGLKTNGIYLTEQGEKIYHLAIQAQKQTDEEKFKGFTEEERQEFYQYLNRIKENLKRD